MGLLDLFEKGMLAIAYLILLSVLGLFLIFLGLIVFPLILGGLFLFSLGVIGFMVIAGIGFFFNCISCGCKAGKVEKKK